MANRDNPHGFKAETNLASGGAITMWKTKLKSNTIVTTGDVVRGAVGYADLENIASTDAILGVMKSKQATSVTTNPTVLFVPAVDWIMFSGQCSGTPTQATIWTNVDIEGTTGAMEISESATTYNVARIIGLKGDSSMGLNAELNFVWNTSAFTGKGGV